MRERSWSLRDADRNAYGQRADRTGTVPSVSAQISEIFRQAEAQQRKDTSMTAAGAIEGLHTARHTANRIRSLAADGVQQLTRDDLKGMRPEQIEQARLDGRLLQLMSGSDDEA